MIVISGLGVYMEYAGIIAEIVEYTMPDMPTCTGYFKKFPQCFLVTLPLTLFIIQVGNNNSPKQCTIYIS